SFAKQDDAAAEPREADADAAADNTVEAVKENAAPTVDMESAEEAARLISSLSKKENESSEENITPVNRASVKDIDLELDKKIIPKTEEFERPVIPEDASYEVKSAALHEHRKKKVENFVLEKEEQSKSEEISRGRLVNGQREFENYEDAPKILNDILQVKSNLFLRICVLLFSGIFSLLVTAANDFGLPLIRVFDRSVSPSSFLFTNTIMGLLAVGVSYTVMTAGVKNMIKRQPDCDSIAAISIFVTVISGIVTLFEPESIRDNYYHVYISAAIFGLIFNTLGKIMIVHRTEKNFRYVAGEFDRYAIKNADELNAENFTKGVAQQPAKLGVMQKTEFVEDFMKNSYSPDISDDFAKKAAPVILLAGIVAAVLSLVFDKHASNTLTKIFVMLATFSGTVTMCSCASLMLAVNIPVSKAMRKFLQYSSVLVGYSAVDEYSDTNSVLVDAAQLFPKESIDLVNLKLLSNNSLEECILMAASLSCQAGSVLNNAFYRILKGKTEMLYPVESYIYEDGLGLSGWINNKRVLLGTRQHMINHSIDGLPTVAKENEYGKGNVVIYLSISGIISTMFVVRVAPGLSVEKWLQELHKEGIVTVVRSVDSFLSESYLEEIFGLESGSIKLLPFRYHKEYQKETDYQPKVSSSMLCGGHFPSFAMLIIGVKRIKSAAQLGLAMQVGSIALGALICIASVMIGSFSQITPTLVVAYNIVFSLISLVTLSIRKI
ncbi:MAG: hypothetical protein IJ129_06680, partial [Ruminococcus sp.]|nr:hypothetical protein [Ruminococcus sp.]